jgi:hypothetical protein
LTTQSAHARLKADQRTRLKGMGHKDVAREVKEALTTEDGDELQLADDEMPPDPNEEPVKPSSFGVERQGDGVIFRSHWRKFIQTEDAQEHGTGSRSVGGQVRAPFLGSVTLRSARTGRKPPHVRNPGDDRSAFDRSTLRRG